MESTCRRGTAEEQSSARVHWAHDHVDPRPASDDPVTTRAFLRGVLGWPFVEDAGAEPEWLIFGSGPSEIGVHSTHGVWDGREYTSPRYHELSFMVDDVEARAELEARGATFSSPVIDRSFGLTTMLDIPGAEAIMLYQPDHPVAYRL